MQPQNKIRLIEIVYCDANEKYDVFVDDDWWGKHYSVEEALTGIKRRIER